MNFTRACAVNSNAGCWIVLVRRHIRSYFFRQTLRLMMAACFRVLSSPLVAVYTIIIYFAVTGEIIIMIMIRLFKFHCAFTYFIQRHRHVFWDFHPMHLCAPLISVVVLENWEAGSEFASFLRYPSPALGQ